MNNIDQLYTETKSMLSHIQNTPESDELLKQIEDFVATRSELIQQMKRKRVMHTTYLNPYNNITIDGTYYDKRK